MTPRRCGNSRTNSIIELEPRGEGNRVLLDGRDVSQRIREADVTAAASRVSVHPRCGRSWWRASASWARNGGVVMEGRDIGTAVFPNADVKIFLDADPTVRAERRVLQNGSLSPEDEAACWQRLPPATSATAPAARRRWFPRPMR